MEYLILRIAQNVQRKFFFHWIFQVLINNLIESLIWYPSKTQWDRTKIVVGILLLIVCFYRFYVC